MSLIKKVIVYWLPVILWMGLIFWLSSFHKLQASPVFWQDFIFRKSAHFFEYAFLYLLFFRAIKNSTKIVFFKLVVISLLLTVWYSLTDEYHQTLVSGRSGRFYDILVDSLGGVLGMSLVVLTLPRLPNKLKFWAKKFGLT